MAAFTLYRFWAIRFLLVRGTDSVLPFSRKGVERTEISLAKLKFNTKSF